MVDGDPLNVLVSQYTLDECSKDKLGIGQGPTFFVKSQYTFGM